MKKQMLIPLFQSYAADYFKINKSKNAISNIEIIGWPDLTFPKEKELNQLFNEEQELKFKRENNK